MLEHLGCQLNAAAQDDRLCVKYECEQAIGLRLQLYVYLASLPKALHSDIVDGIQDHHPRPIQTLRLRVYRR